MRRGRARVGVVVIGASLLGCAGAKPPLAERPRPASVRAATPAETLALGQRELASSRYAEAERTLSAAAKVPATAAAAELALAELFLLTGRHSPALAAAERAAQLDAGLATPALELRVEALRKSGRLDEAEAALGGVEGREDAPGLRLLLGELLLDTGRRARAEPVLLSIIEDYNEDRIGEGDGPGLAVAARAAWLLRHPKDADTLFNEAEQAAPGDPKTLLWRAELFLEKYDSAHAEEVLREVLQKAPRHPLALTLLAHVRLEQAYDFDEAERLSRLALDVNPALAAAHFVLSGIALRDMELELAERRIADGLRHDSRNLELWALRVTARFLADDAAGFEREKRALLAHNPEYSRLYAILGEFADWEHRYDEIVVLMREALGIDAEDPSALAQLGFNLIRAGNEGEGVRALGQAFRLDPYNVRVYNTLNLYETLIPKAYVTVPSPPFNIRYHVDDRPVLERYVPELLQRAWASMQETYGFTPSTPIGVEIYAERESFAVRTSGLPQTAIQGVCFGKTLASMSPRHESFNLGMTLWHELSHVFHIQLSNSRVPRWFTEGLAEYETSIARPEWTREHDPELYAMWRRDKLPEVARMSRAFTRAEDIADVATAYYASNQIVAMLAQKTGHAGLSALLRGWASGKRGDEVFRSVLGSTGAELDHAFRSSLETRLARYARAFVPQQHAPPLAVAEQLAHHAPRSADAAFELAFALLRAGEPQRAAEQAERVLKLDPAHAQARYLRARVAVAAGDAKQAQALVSAMLRDGQAGYAVHLLAGELARARQDVAAARAAFEAAHAADPTQTDALQALADLAAAEKVPEEEVRHLEKLARLSEHSAAVHRRLVRQLLALGRTADAVRAGEAALWADIDGLGTHVAFAEALLASGDRERARFELETATLCQGEPPELADAHARLAGVLAELGRRNEARAARARALELDPANSRAQNLKL